ncbi:MAG: DUF2270 domain-containing protein [Candidatus Thermoplasmatota archaeon]|nr:DUF2270 domain-containing protein [Candidatus Thermoplasmatota archaeon]MBS3790332.1 DUF2270 domain-containing protein [Candidatus Thermoplasmatota archaeon]
MKEPDPEQFVDHQDSGDFTTVITHMYRAEVQRSYNWRKRLDRTTEWSIVILSALTTWTFSVPGRRHELLLSVLIFMGTLLWIEARRYRYYNVWASRIKTLEENFLAKTLSPDKEVSTREWMKTLADDLKHPRFKIPFWVAVAHRLRRVYFWLFSLTTMLWIGKLAIHPKPAQSFRMMIDRAAILGSPGYVVVILIGILLLGAGILAMFGSTHEAKGAKIVERRKTSKDWEKMT